MNALAMTSMQRTLTTLGHKEPDRVPLFLSLTMHGAKELGMSLANYFSRAEHVVQGQLRLREKYDNDCLIAFSHAAQEVEAFGGEVLLSENGPANAGPPIIHSPEDVAHLEPPRIEDCPGLEKTLTTITGLKEAVGDEVPIVGVVISPFSLPVMQMGFESYLLLMYENPGAFAALMAVNETFCIRWANAQLAAGATAICYFDPVSSPTIIPREKYLRTGFLTAKRTLSGIQGATVTHMASGMTLPIIDDLAKTGTGGVGVSVLEDLGSLKTACRNRLTILGNLNGVAMRRWTPEQAEDAVRTAIAQAGEGGGFILTDNHGEIPFQVPDEILLAISRAARKWGRYPLSVEK
ncbi:uroporphyrinogen decarboxylase family protein [Desulfoplanes sp.]